MAHSKCPPMNSGFQLGVQQSPGTGTQWPRWVSGLDVLCWLKNPWRSLLLGDRFWSRWDLQKGSRWHKLMMVGDRGSACQWSLANWQQCPAYSENFSAQRSRVSYYDPTVCLVCAGDDMRSQNMSLVRQMRSSPGVSLLWNAMDIPRS